MNVLEALGQASQRLKKAGIAEYRLESEFVLASVLGVPRLKLALLKNEALPERKRVVLNRWLAERSKRKPLAYVLGEQPFMDLSLQVNPSVFIPRPETEWLVERAAHWLDQIHHAKVVDVGAGSGNIAISLAKHPHVEQLIGIDISKKALAVAQKNSRRHNMNGTIQWLQGDLLIPLLSRHPPRFSPLSFPAVVSRESMGPRLQHAGVTACLDSPLKTAGNDEGWVHLVIANLPYVSSRELARLSPEVQWEPRRALDGGNDGLAVISRLIPQAHKVLKSGGVLLLEIGAGQSEILMDHFSKEQAWINAKVYNDLAGIPRIVEAQKIKNRHG